MEYFVIILIAYLAATTLRVLLLKLIASKKKSHIDLIKAVGTLYHGSYSHALLKGLGQHYFIGLINAVIYFILISVFNPGSAITSCLYGALLGFFHGCVVSFTLTVIVDENHPIPEFREYGYEVAVYYWVAQILYGAVLGAIIGMA